MKILRAARAAVLISYKNEGDDLTKNADFQTRSLSLVGNRVWTFSDKNDGDNLDTNSRRTFTSQKRNHPWLQPLLHGYRISHGDDLNENGNFKVQKLIIRGYKTMRGGDLNENKQYKNRLNKYII